MNREFTVVEPMYRKNPEGTKIILPTRGTEKSAGYDIYCPVDIEIPAGGVGGFWTDIRASMPDDEFFWITPRSSTGDLGLMLVNTSGIIDSDYYDNTSTGGNIKVKLFNYTKTAAIIKARSKVVQGIFMNYHITDNDTATGLRTGGHGSTGA